MSETFDKQVTDTKEVFTEEMKTQVRARIHDVIEEKKDEILRPIQEKDEGGEEEEEEKDTGKDAEEDGEEEEEED